MQGRDLIQFGFVGVQVHPVGDRAADRAPDNPEHGVIRLGEAGDVGGMHGARILGV